MSTYRLAAAALLFLTLAIATANAQPPTIFNFTPDTGKEGVSVSIQGTKFTGATKVLFGTTQATFRVLNDVTILAKVPAGFIKGFVTVVAPSGTVVSKQLFTSNVTTANFVPDPNLKDIVDSSGNSLATLFDQSVFGNSMHAVGDLNGDGFNDVVIGMPADNGRGTKRGAIMIVYLNKEYQILRTQTIGDGVGGFAGVLADNDGFGASVVSTGDIDKDGVPDLVVGASRYVPLTKVSGAGSSPLWFLCMNADGTVKKQFKVTPKASHLSYGVRLTAIDDLDGDGIRELFVGDPLSGGLRGLGACWVIFIDYLNLLRGVDPGNGFVTRIEAAFEGSMDYFFSEGFLGNWVEFIGDVDKDGVGDVLVDFPTKSEHVLFLAFLNADGSLKSLRTVTTLDTDYLSFCGIQDINGDQVPDILVSLVNPALDDQKPSEIHAITLNANGTKKDMRLVYKGTAGNDVFGNMLVFLGDNNNNGYPEVAFDHLSPYSKPGISVIELGTPPKLTVTNPNVPANFITNGQTTITFPDTGLSNPVMVECTVSADRFLGSTLPVQAPTVTGPFSLKTVGFPDPPSLTESKPSFKLRIHFNPTAKGTYAGTITIPNGDPDNPPFTFFLSATVVNSAPIGLSMSAKEVEENTPASNALASLTTTDLDSQDTHTYELVPGAGSDDNDKFSIIGNLLYLKSPADYETQSGYSIRIRTTDNDGEMFDEPFAINVIDKPEGPVVDAVTFSIAENAIASSIAGTIAVSGFYKAPLRFSIVAGNENETFGVTSEGELYVNNPTALNFEERPEFSLLVEVVDANGVAARADVKVQLLDINEAPTSLALAPSAVNENVPVSTVVGLLLATDEDAAESFTFSLTGSSSYPDNSQFAIVGDRLVINESPNFEKQASYKIAVRVSDRAGLWLEKEFEITVVDQPEPPRVTETVVALLENADNGTLVTTVDATDHDGDIVDYEIISGNYQDAFSIGADGAITVNSSAALNYEVQANITLGIEVTDATGLKAQGRVTINLTDGNDAPTSLTITNATVDENAPAGTVVGQFLAEDEDKDELFTYTLAGGSSSADNATFDIADNQLALKESPDFEIKSEYIVLVRVTDQGGLWIEKELQVHINNAPDAPEIVNTSASIAENSNAGTVVTNVTAADQDGDIEQYAIVSGNYRDAFSIDAATGVITIGDAGAVDFEQTSVVALTISVIDSSGLTGTGVVTIYLVDINEPPTSIDLDREAFRENQPTGTPVGLLASADTDAGEIHSYQLVQGDGDDDNNSFVLQGNQLFTATIADYETKQNYRIRVEVIDKGANRFQRSIDIHVLDVNENDLIFIPTLFSPNDDGMNDRFLIRSDEINELRFTVYSSSGKEVYSTTDVDQATFVGWDGTNGGSPVPAGVYNWFLSGSFKDGQAIKVNGATKGSVLLAR